MNRIWIVITPTFHRLNDDSRRAFLIDLDYNTDLMPEVNLSVTNLTKSFQNFGDTLEVLDNISLFVKKHEFVSILGPSGCGKSTFLNILAGTVKTDKGTIEINNEILNDQKGHAGYMMQEDLLFPWKTVAENIMIGPIIKGKSESFARNTTNRLLEEFKLIQYSRYYPKQLSGGLKQRIALLRTVAYNSELLLLDEPFGSLDALTRYSLQKYLIELKKKLHLSILFITHDIREALELSDRIYIFSKRPAKIIKIINLKTNRIDSNKLEREIHKLLKTDLL